MKEGKVNFKEVDFLAEEPEMVKVEKEPQEISEEPVSEGTARYNGYVSCLRNEVVQVKLIEKATGLVNDPNHVYYGGMAPKSSYTLSVPRETRSGNFVNVLTDAEKDFLEAYMGLEANALSKYRKKDNMWSDANPNGFGKVTLQKRGNVLDLSNPVDYIKYKVLLANKDYICPSLTALQENPKATYKFYIVSESEESRIAQNKMNSTMESYMKFGEIKTDFDLLRTLVEGLTGSVVAPTTKLEFLHKMCNDLIQKNASVFLRAIKDPLLPTKSLIKRAVEAGLISYKGDYLYLKSDGSPLCEQNENPTLIFAAKYLNSPKHQDLKLSLEAKLNG